jgi:hypothetical protein
MKTIKKYCPDMPAERVHGEMGFFGKFDSRVLSHGLGGRHNSRRGSRDKHELDSAPSTNQSTEFLFNVSIREKLVTQLAAFVYNLTTCPIPSIESRVVVFISDSVWWK